MILLIDNFDSFSWNIYHYVLQTGAECKLLRNDSFRTSDMDVMNISGIIFSPGPKTPQDHPIIFEVLEKYHKSIPILGICLGFQAIGEFFGGKTVKGNPVHGKTSTIYHSGHLSFKDIPNPFKATRYHSLTIKEEDNSELETTASSEDGVPMSFAHKKYRIWGHQFHPEAILTEYGFQIIRNWIVHKD
jgi:anthranilate synthase/aminodeoxychorismate synthase-like glutamine amidotransferase